MIKPANKPTGSIKKAEIASVKSNTRVSNGDEPLIGRTCYSFCEGCKVYSIHRVYTDYTKCWSCGNPYHFGLRGIQNIKSNNQFIKLFMI